MPIDRGPKSSIYNLNIGSEQYTTADKQTMPSISIRWNVGARQRCAGDGSRGRVLRNRSNWRGSGLIGSELKNATFANPRAVLLT